MIIRKNNCAIRWIKMYPVDNVIHPLNNWGLIIKLPFKQLQILACTQFLSFWASIILQLNN